MTILIALLLQLIAAYVWYSLGKEQKLRDLGKHPSYFNLHGDPIFKVEPMVDGTYTIKIYDKSKVVIQY